MPESQTVMPYPALPSYRDPRAALAIALPSLAAPDRISVTDAAELYMRVRVGGQWQEFSRDVTPYMVEPTDMVMAREFRGLALCGPSQCGKTQMLQSVTAYTIKCDPGRLAIFQMTRDAAKEFEADKIGPMIRQSVDLAERQMKGRGSDNIFEKSFRGGTRLTLDWPTITKLSSATMRTVLMTDYDHFPDSIDGEGEAFTLGLQRVKTMGSRGTCAAEGSPAKPILVDNWHPATLHEAPPVSGGILGLYNQGTRARFYWTCPHCGHEFTPIFAHLNYDADLSPADAGAAAVLVCPESGCIIEHSSKRQLNAEGRWLHESKDGTRAVPVDDPDRRSSDMVSYWISGVMAAFSRWSDLVQAVENAKRVFVETGNEEKLRSVTNTELGEPYLPRAMAGDADLDLTELRSRLEVMPQGVAPGWTRFLTIGVDVQATRFAVQVTAWGDFGESAIIDRFDIFTPPDDAPGGEGRQLDPARYTEDWEVLTALLSRVWMVDGTDYGLMPRGLGVDYHGAPGVSDRAIEFWKRRRAEGMISRVFLVRGHGGFKIGDRVWYASPERGNAKQRARGLKLLNVATDKMKDSVIASLQRADGGAGACHLYNWMQSDWIDEFGAEMRTEKGWKKRPGVVRNESLDLAGYAKAVAIHLGLERLTPEKSPDWAERGLLNPLAVSLSTDEREAALLAPIEPTMLAAVRKPQAPKPARPRRIKYLSR